MKRILKRTRIAALAAALVLALCAQGVYASEGEPIDPPDPDAAIRTSADRVSSVPDLSQAANVSAGQERSYDGTAWDPHAVLTNKATGETLKEGVHYTRSVQSNVIQSDGIIDSKLTNVDYVNPGTVVETFTGIDGQYTGKISVVHTTYQEESYGGTVYASAKQTFSEIQGLIPFFKCNGPLEPLIALPLEYSNELKNVGEGDHLAPGTYTMFVSCFAVTSSGIQPDMVGWTETKDGETSHFVQNGGVFKLHISPFSIIVEAENPDPGQDPGSNPDPGQDPGTNPDPGNNPGTQPDPGQNPGQNPGQDPGSNPQVSPTKPEVKPSAQSQTSATTPQVTKVTKIASSDQPNTGDSSDLALMLTILIAAIATIGVVAKNPPRKNDVK